MLLSLAQGGSSEPIGARLYYVDLQQREQWKTEPRHHQSDKSRRIDQFCVTSCVTFNEHWLVPHALSSRQNELKLWLSYIKSCEWMALMGSSWVASLADAKWCRKCCTVGTFGSQLIRNSARGKVHDSVRLQKPSLKLKIPSQQRNADNKLCYVDNRYGELYCPPSRYTWWTVPGVTCPIMMCSIQAWVCLSAWRAQGYTVQLYHTTSTLTITQGSRIQGTFWDCNRKPLIKMTEAVLESVPLDWITYWVPSISLCHVLGS